MPYLELLEIGLDGSGGLAVASLGGFWGTATAVLAELLFRTCWKADTTGVWLPVLSQRGYVLR